MKKILIVFGTRPEAIKMAPLVNELKQKQDSAHVEVCVTAQHRDLLDQVLSYYRIQPKYDLNIMSSNQSLFTITEKILTGMKTVLEDFMPDWVLVHGDTTTSFATALAAFYHGAKIGHVEAGLRTNNLRAPYPEEANRQLTARLADMHFAPTELCRENLLRENISKEKIVITGNTIVDALIDILEQSKNNDTYCSTLEQIHPNLLKNSPVILITAHRRENFGSPIQKICEAIKECANTRADALFIYPVHPNPSIRMTVHKLLGGVSNIFLTSPLSYLQMTCLMNRATLILTDSGGIQEEAPTFGKKILVLREVTERQEAVAAGAVELVGSNTQLIIKRTLELLDLPEPITFNPFGDGKAASRIVHEILRNDD